MSEQKHNHPFTHRFHTVEHPDCLECAEPSPEPEPAPASEAQLGTSALYVTKAAYDARLAELVQLRASHKRLVEALEELIFASNALVAEAYLRDARAEIAEARKLEGK